MSRTTFSANCIDGPAKAGACWPPHRSLHIYRMYKLNYTAEDAQALKPHDIAKPGVKLASGFASGFAGLLYNIDVEMTITADQLNHATSQQRRLWFALVRRGRHGNLLLLIRRNLHSQAKPRNKPTEALVVRASESNFLHIPTGGEIQEQSSASTKRTISLRLFFPGNNYPEIRGCPSIFFVLAESI